MYIAYPKAIRVTKKTTKNSLRSKIIATIMDINFDVCLKILQKYKNLIHIKKQAIAFNGLSY